MAAIQVYRLRLLGKLSRRQDTAPITSSPVVTLLSLLFARHPVSQLVGSAANAASPVQLS